MDYLYLLIACTFFSLQFIFTKFFESRTKGGFSISLYNGVICGVVAALFLLVKSGLPTDMNLGAFIIVLLYSVSCIVCGITTFMAMTYGKVSAVTTFCLAGGMVVPFFYGIYLNENPGVFKWIGIVVLMISLIPTLLKKEEKSGKSNKFIYIVCIILVFLTNGLVSIFSKMHQISSFAVSEDNFIMTASIVKIVLSLIIMITLAFVSFFKGEKKAFTNAFWEIGTKKMTIALFALLVLFAGTYSICNTLGNIFSLKCMLTMDASIQFPILSAVVIILGAVFGRVFFKEKITKDIAISLILSCVGIGLFMIP